MMKPISISIDVEHAHTKHVDCGTLDSNIIDVAIEIKDPSNVLERLVDDINQSNLEFGEFKRQTATSLEHQRFIVMD